GAGRASEYLSSGGGLFRPRRFGPRLRGRMRGPDPDSAPSVFRSWNLALAARIDRLVARRSSGLGPGGPRGQTPGRDADRRPRRGADLHVLRAPERRGLADALRTVLERRT